MSKTYKKSKTNNGTVRQIKEILEELEVVN